MKRGASRRKFYEITPYRRGGLPGFTLENKDAFPSGINRLSDLDELPRFIFDKARGRLPRDLERWSAVWLISDRTKVVFESVDARAFSFVPCAARTPKGVWDGPQHWLCQVLRILDVLDEPRSRLKIGIRGDPRHPKFGQKYYEFGRETELVFQEDLIGNAHVFRMAHFESNVICDQEMQNACKSAGLRGLLFRDVRNLGW